MCSSDLTEKSSRSAEGLYKFFIYFVLVLLAVTISTASPAHRKPTPVSMAPISRYKEIRPDTFVSANNMIISMVI